MTLFLLLLACRAPDDQGQDATIVGNPGKMAARVAKSEDTTTETAELEVLGGTLGPCDGSDAADLGWQAVWDLVDGEADEVPAGDWCDLTLELHPPLEIVGDGGEGGSFQLLLEVETVSVSSGAGFHVDDNHFVLELAAPDWIPVDRLTSDGDRPVVVDAEHELHDTLAAAITRGSALYADDDEDSEVGEAERDAGSQARGDDHHEAGTDTDTGPSDTGDRDDTDGDDDSQLLGCQGEDDVDQSGWCLLPLLLAGRRRFSARVNPARD